MKKSATIALIESSEQFFSLISLTLAEFITLIWVLISDQLAIFLVFMCLFSVRYLSSQGKTFMTSFSLFKVIWWQMLSGFCVTDNNSTDETWKLQLSLDNFCSWYVPMNTNTICQFEPAIHISDFDTVSVVLIGLDWDTGTLISAFY